MKTNLKENKGITLIALIITIIVLLILAVVTITAVSEGNIFNHANNAATRYNAAATEENAIIANYLSEMEKHDGDGDGDDDADLIGRLVYALFYEDDDEAFDKIIEAGITEEMLDHPLYQMEGTIGEYNYDYYKFNSNGDELLVRNGSFISHDQTEIYNEIYPAIELESELKEAFENKNITIDQFISILDNNQLQNYVTIQINSVKDQNKKEKGEFYVTINNVKFLFESNDASNYYIEKVEISK